MNKINNKSLGKRSTNTASLSNAISSIKSSISPVIKTSRAASNPKPLKGNGEMWIPRTVRIFSSVPSTSSSGLGLSISSIFANAQVTGQIRVLGLKVWNYTNQAGSTNYIGFTTGESVTETAVTTAVNDVGSATSLPGVQIQIPRTIASNLSTSSALVGTISVLPNGSTTYTQTICTDVHFEYKTDASN